MTGTARTVIRQSTCIAIDGRAVLIDGVSGSGKSSLALALIDRGAILVADDGVMLEAMNSRLVASPHPNTQGLIEVRNLGILEMPFLSSASVALSICLDQEAPRFIDSPETIEIDGCHIPAVRLWPREGPLAIKAELALMRFGIPAG